MKYVATASVRIQIEFDPPEPDVPNTVTDEMISERDDEAIEAVDEVRINVGKHAEDMVPGALHNALDGVGTVQEITIEQVEEVDGS